MTMPALSRRRALLWVGATFAATTLVPAGAARVVREKVLLDTDIGSDIDDAVALAYLLAQPRCELLGVTTVTGESHRRAELASVLCHAAGKPSVPILPGAEQPLLVGERQPTANQFQHIGSWRRRAQFPKAGAIAFLQQMIRRHPGEITLLAVGPLTNIALLCRIDPEAMSMLKQVVLMSGVFAPDGVRWPDGNVSRIEWNVLLDPHAAAIVTQFPRLAVRAYPLDVTMQVVLSREEFHARLASWRGTRPVVDFAQAWFSDERRTSQLHDPLAATSIFAPSICQLTRGRIAVDLAPGPDFGRTNFVADSAGVHEVALRVDPQKFFHELFGVFEAR